MPNILATFKKYKIEIIVFSIAFFIRFGYATAIQSIFGSHTFLSFSDGAMYQRIAGNLLNYHTISQATVTPNLVPDLLRTPIYPLFLAFFIWLKTPFLVAITVQNFLAGLTAIIIYRLGIKIFQLPVVGIIAAIIYSLEPMSIYWNNLLMSEGLASFFFILAIYLFVSKKYYWSAFIMGLAALTRPTFFYLFPLPVIMYLYLNRAEIFIKSKDHTRLLPHLRTAFITFLIFFLTVFPWMLRNKIQFNTWDLSSNGWFALYYFNAREFAEMKNIPYKFAPYPVTPDYLPNIPERDFIYYFEPFNVPYYKNYLFNLFSAHPADFTKFHLISALHGFNNHDYGYIIEYVLRAKVPSFSSHLGAWLVNIGQYAWYVIYGLIIIGFFAKDKRHWLIFLAGFYLLNNLLTGYISMVSAGGRYNLPFLPLTLLLASYGFFQVCAYFKKCRLSKP